MVRILPIIPALPPTTPLLPQLGSGQAGFLPASASLAAQVAELVVPAAGPPPNAPAPSTIDPAALRPDQLFMARQMAYTALDGPALAANWRSMVRAYGEQLQRSLQGEAGVLTPAQRLSGQQGLPLRHPDTQHPPPDAWRFTVHAGNALAHELAVLGEREDAPPGRRKRARFALRLELRLDDGSLVMLQVEYMPGGVDLALCARDEGVLVRLRELQPSIEQAVARAGLKVARWRFLKDVPPGMAHGTMAADQAAQALNQAVFRVLAELALALPGGLQSHADP